MFSVAKHKCKSTEIKCFDCRQPICRECMVVQKNSLICKKCDPSKNQKIRVQIEGLNGQTQLFFLSLFFGFVGFEFMEVTYEFLAGMMWLVAALVGVAMAEALNRASIPQSRRALLPFAIFGVIFGAVLSNVTQSLISGHALSFGLSLVPLPVELFIICLAIRFRFKT